MAVEKETITFYVEEKLSSPKASRRIRNIIADAFAFVRSAEVNKAIGTVTLEQLMNDHIARNGDTDRSNARQFDPYSYDATTDYPASEDPLQRANFLSGTDTQRPTKLDRILAIKNELEGVIEEVKAMEPLDVAEAEEYEESNAND